jgi:hypothetical protein
MRVQSYYFFLTFLVFALVFFFANVYFFFFLTLSHWLNTLFLLLLQQTFRRPLKQRHDITGNAFFERIKSGMTGIN